jgi:hypothetical protein
MNLNLRLTVLYLALGYWLALWMFTSGWAVPIPILPLAYPIYRCGRQFCAGRVWYLGALISIGLASIPLALAQGCGLLAFFLFFAVGNLHLAVKVNNLQAATLLATGVLATPLGFNLAGTAGIIGEGSGLLMLILSAPGLGSFGGSPSGQAGSSRRCARGARKPVLRWPFEPPLTGLLSFFCLLLFAGRAWSAFPDCHQS